MANIIRVGGGAGNAAHKLVYEYSSDGTGDKHFYSDVCDTENSNSKSVGYMLFAKQTYNFTGHLTLQGSDDGITWADIDSVSPTNGYDVKIGSAIVSYRFFRCDAFRRSAYGAYKALIYAVEQ